MMLARLQEAAHSAARRLLWHVALALDFSDGDSFAGSAVAVVVSTDNPPQGLIPNPLFFSQFLHWMIQ